MIVFQEAVTSTIGTIIVSTMSASFHSFCEQEGVHRTHCIQDAVPRSAQQYKCTAFVEKE